MARSVAGGGAEMSGGHCGRSAAVAAACRARSVLVAYDPV